MSVFTVHINARQLSRLGSQLTEASVVVAERTSAAVRKTAMDIEATAKQLAPVDTGFLRSSISTTVRGRGVSTTAVVGPTAEYGIYQELGTSRMAAHPYLAPAFDQKIPQLQRALTQVVGRI